MKDPYAEKKSLWPKVMIVGILVYIAYVIIDITGYITSLTGRRFGHKESMKVLTPPDTK